MNIEIANKLQKLRKENHYSQEQLANELGISRQAVSKWERAEASPDTDNLICLAKLYGVTLDELLSCDKTIEEIKEDNLLKEKEENNNCEKEGDIPIQFLSNKVIFTDTYTKETKEFKFKKKHHNSLYDALISISTLLTIMVYFLLGGLKNMWHPGWIVFILIPVIVTFIEAIRQKRFTVFAFPILCTVIYLILGFYKSLWHPSWIIFLTIPIYYVLASSIDDLIHKNDDMIKFKNETYYVKKLCKDNFNELKEKLSDHKIQISFDDNIINISYIN